MKDKWIGNKTNVGSKNVACDKCYKIVFNEVME